MQLAISGIEIIKSLAFEAVYRCLSLTLHSLGLSDAPGGVAYVFTRLLKPAGTFSLGFRHMPGAV